MKKLFEDRLVELRELFEILGCKDERTAIRWCNNNNFAIVKLGKKKYIDKVELDIYLSNLLENSEKVILKKLEKTSFITKPSNKNNTKANNSKSALDYITKFKAA